MLLVDGELREAVCLHQMVNIVHSDCQNTILRMHAQKSIPYEFIVGYLHVTEYKIHPIATVC